MARLSRDRAAVVSGLLMPLIASLLLIPSRGSSPTVDTILILLAVVIAVSASGNRLASWLATVSAIVWFDFFLAPPYESLDWFSAEDLWIVVLIVVIGSAVSELAVRLRRQQREKDLANKRLTMLYEASVAIGTTLDVERTAQELVQVLVPRFADFATVDLSIPVLNDQLDDGAGLRRGAIGSADSHSLQIHGPDPPGQIAIAQQGRSLVVPLLARGISTGVVTCWRTEQAEPFVQNDVSFAEELAGKASAAIDNARRYSRERSTALTLQRSLLPQGLPEHQAVETASRYLPASPRSGVGGDWFDVIPLAGARVALVVGDVVGHGIHASATMGKLRTALRTLAEVDLSPDELLTHLDDLVIHLSSDRHSGASEGDTIPAGEVGATCLYAIYDPVSGHCALATAGHPLPLLIDPDGTVELVSGHVGPLLGLGGLPFETIEMDLAAGTVLALYTDGLVQSRERDFDQGLAELRRVLALPSPSLEASCDTVIDTLLADRPADDVALLMARTLALPPDRVATWDIPDDPALVARARKQASDQLNAWGLEESSFVTELVVSELVTNAIRYGATPIQLRLIRDHGLICEVSDSSNTAPHLRRARVFDEGGRGLLLVAQLTQSWGTRQTTSGKIIWCEQALP